MSAREQAEFEADCDHEAAVALRRADDAGKVAGLGVAAPESWRPVMRRVAAEAVRREQDRMSTSRSRAPLTES
ncbi:hypothetical protein ABT272_17855 [Streptomyces sp900105245]|uniref:Uncharacterized protein n=1 Tax=Streptomyces sp. 900105245 TaxID=3154379 RepID=A0ABV1U7C6_9ACTN